MQYKYCNPEYISCSIGCCVVSINVEEKRRAQVLMRVETRNQKISTVLAIIQLFPQKERTKPERRLQFALHVDFGERSCYYIDTVVLSQKAVTHLD